MKKMKSQNIIFICAALVFFSCMPSHGERSHCVTDMKAIAKFAKQDGMEIEDYFWMPSSFPTKEYEEATQRYIQKILSDELTNEFRFFLQNFRPDMHKCNIVFAGVVQNQKKVIICQLSELPPEGKKAKDKLYSIWTGEKVICTSTYDPEAKKILSCRWDMN